MRLVEWCPGTECTYSISFVQFSFCLRSASKRGMCSCFQRGSRMQVTRGFDHPVSTNRQHRHVFKPLPSNTLPAGHPSSWGPHCPEPDMNPSNNHLTVGPSLFLLLLFTVLSELSHFFIWAQSLPFPGRHPPGNLLPFLCQFSSRALPLSPPSASHFSAQAPCWTTCKYWACLGLLWCLVFFWWDNTSHFQKQNFRERDSLFQCLTSSLNNLLTASWLENPSDWGDVIPVFEKLCFKLAQDSHDSLSWPHQKRRY